MQSVSDIGTPLCLFFLTEGLADVFGHQKTSKDPNRQQKASASARC